MHSRQWQAKAEEGRGDEEEAKEKEWDNQQKDDRKKRWMEDKRLHFYESVSVCDWSNWLLVLQRSEAHCDLSLWSHAQEIDVLQDKRRIIA